MEHRVPHDLGRDLGKRATTAAFAAYAAKYAEYKPRMTWTSDYAADAAFTVKGMDLKGSIVVHEREVTLDLSVPLLLRPFKSKALEVIEREIRVWIDKAKKGGV
ncbi:MAG: polyhydroxyalkanoic acid system family protein [Polyangiaceae bacterium]|jgi:hypothetical protein|nr:polyhydroxyalkanoic acid system family protein [Polyangiaceae bacterium]MBK8942610.1 polyhydroxyalkanoic acid system family protein [Polyangiaceae bacterium]